MPTPGAGDTDEVLLLLLRTFDTTIDGEERPVVIRYAKGAWERGELPDLGSIPPPENRLGYSPLLAAFADHRTAYVAGWVGNEGSVLLRSSDAGVRWEDATSELPRAFRVRVGGNLVSHLAFRGPAEAWLIGGGLISGVLVLVNDRAAPPWSEKEWARIDGSFGFGRSGHRLLFRRGVVDLTYDMSAIQRVRPEVGPAMGLRPDRDLRMRASSAVGDRAWLAGAERTASGFVQVIYAAALGDAEWTAQELDRPGDGGLTSIDMRDGERGIACGSDNHRGELSPVCFFTDDGGAIWQRAEMPDDLSGFEIRYALRTRGDGAWAVAERRTAERVDVRVLESTDAGRSFAPGPLLVPGEAVATAFVRSTAAPLAP